MAMSFQSTERFLTIEGNICIGIIALSHFIVRLSMFGQRFGRQTRGANV